jgi:hypothetical protein
VYGILELQAHLPLEIAIIITSQLSRIKDIIKDLVNAAGHIPTCQHIHNTVICDEVCISLKMR